MIKKNQFRYMSVSNQNKCQIAVTTEHAKKSKKLKALLKCLTPLVIFEGFINKIII